jgi:hypothetical protein
MLRSVRRELTGIAKTPQYSETSIGKRSLQKTNGETRQIEARIGSDAIFWRAEVPSRRTVGSKDMEKSLT